MAHQDKIGIIYTKVLIFIIHTEFPKSVRKHTITWKWEKYLNVYFKKRRISNAKQSFVMVLNLPLECLKKPTAMY